LDLVSRKNRQTGKPANRLTGQRANGPTGQPANGLTGPRANTSIPPGLDSGSAGHRGRHAKRSSGKMVRISICCCGPFPKSPSQGFREKIQFLCALCQPGRSFMRSLATLRLSIPYFCKRSIFRATATNGRRNPPRRPWGGHLDTYPDLFYTLRIM